MPNIDGELLEKDIEGRLIKRTKDIGGVCYKFTSPNKRSVPDRICLFDTGLIIFVECKRPGEKPTILQRREIKKLKALGFYACYVDTYEGVEKLIKWVIEELVRREHGQR